MLREGHSAERVLPQIKISSSSFFRDVSEEREQDLDNYEDVVGLCNLHTFRNL